MKLIGPKRYLCLPAGPAVRGKSTLPLLYGDFDRHLARIEQALGVSIASRGNTLTISGAPAEVDVARLSLEDLYVSFRGRPRGVLG